MDNKNQLHHLGQRLGLGRQGQQNFQVSYIRKTYGRSSEYISECIKGRSKSWYAYSKLPYVIIPHRPRPIITQFF